MRLMQAVRTASAAARSLWRPAILPFAAAAALQPFPGAAWAAYPSPATPRTCDENIRRAFDFWIGEWTVASPSSPAFTASSTIAAAEDGCVIIEKYSSNGGRYTGVSINLYDARIGRWRQTWVDNTGAAIYFVGGPLEDGVMRMEDATDPGFLKRATWSKLSDGRVRQHGERSTDGGATWFTVFDGYYSRSATGADH